MTQKKVTRKLQKKAKPKTQARSGAANSGPGRYPRQTVESALRVPQAILDQNAGRACSEKQAADFLGIKVSGPFKQEVGSAIKYGFLERPQPGKMQPTELAKKILRPQFDGDERHGYREAILRAPDISEVYKHYRGENLPDLQFFRNTVVDTYKIPTDKVDEFQDVFLHSLETAGLLEKHGEKVRILDITEDDGAVEFSSDRIKKLGKTANVQAGDTCFVMQPFASPLGDYYDKVYKPAIEKAGLTPVRADEDIFGTGKIMDQVWSGIITADVLVAELTSRNPNVFYELGLAHALKKPVVLVSATEQDVPFDLQHIRVIYYDMTDPFWGNKLLDKVAENILSAIANPEEAIFQGKPTE